MNIKLGSIGNKIALFNSYTSSPSAQKGTPSVAPKLINKLSGLSNTCLSKLSSAETGASAAKPRTAPKFSIYITNNNGKKTLSPLANRTFQHILEDFPPTKGQTAAERNSLALNKLESNIKTIGLANVGHLMPKIIRINATPPSLPTAPTAPVITLKEDVIPPPPPPPPATAPTPYVRKEIQAASKQEIDQHRAEQQSKNIRDIKETDKQNDLNKGAKNFAALISGELKMNLPPRIE
ncbi:hypothetical protein ACXV6R_002273 [Yersinia enterocolitica]